MKQKAKERDDKLDLMMFDLWLTDRLLYGIASMFSKQNRDFPSYEEYRAPKNNEKTRRISEAEKIRIRERANKFKKKISGGN